MTSDCAPLFDPETTSIRAVIPAPGGGHLAMAGFPGLEKSFNGDPFIDPALMSETLAGLCRTGARHLMVLPEEAELPEGAFTFLRQQAEDLGLKLTFQSIEDFGVPQAEFLAHWPKCERVFLEVLGRGETVALCCQYGAGRSGVVAAMLLVACGMSPGAAILRVRSHFDEAIENELQENWLKDRPSDSRSDAG